MNKKPWGLADAEIDNPMNLQLRASRKLGPSLISASPSSKPNLDSFRFDYSSKDCNSSVPSPIPSSSSKRKTPDLSFLEDEDCRPANPLKNKGGKKRFVVNSSDDESEDSGSVKPPDATAQEETLALDTDTDDKTRNAAMETEDALGQIWDIGTCDDAMDASDDPVTQVLRKCEVIAMELRQKLNPDSRASSRSFSSKESSNRSSHIISQAQVRAACGQSKFELKPYQLVGVNFMLLLYRQAVGGAILADEMGLGKTAQAIVFLSLLSHLESDPGPHLVLAPASLLENWQRELNQWCPAFKTVLYHGSDRASIRNNFAPSFNVMLTCYSLFERDSMVQKDDRKFLRRFSFSCVLMDEAHLLKDSSAMRTRRVRDMVAGARHRLMLTGTPLQNDLQELWALLELLMPQIFDSRAEDLSEYLGSRQDNANISSSSDLVGRMKAIMGPFVLRRVKADVMKQLVPKIHKVNMTEMVEEQAAAYLQAVEEYRQSVAAREASLKSKVQPGLMAALPRKQISSIFTHLRKLANHPLLVRRLYKEVTLSRMARVLHGHGVFGDQCTEQRVLEEIREYNDYTLHKLCVAHKAIESLKLPGDAVMQSGKCQALARLLPHLESQGHRVLLFSQWTSMLDILEWLLEELGFRFVRLDGSTQVVERQALVDEYNSNADIFAFLLSTRAGGQGLNLTGADTVVLHDVDFNPQVDRQAEDRCHRIGQTKPVTVYRLVSKNSVDENILGIADRKLNLDAAVLDPSTGVGAGTGKDPDGGDPSTMAGILSSILGCRH